MSAALQNVQFDIPAELGARLAELAKQKGLDGRDRLARRIILDYLEDLEDLAIAEDALAEFKANGETGVPWEDVKRDLGLDD